MTGTLSLSDSQEAREDLFLEEEIDRKLSLVLSAKNVTPRDKAKLKGLLKYYAKKPKPFTACVRDNTKRFGKDGAERVCATLKDIIKGTTKWRKGRKRKNLSDDLLPDTDPPEIDDRTAELLDSLTEQQLGELIYV